MTKVAKSPRSPKLKSPEPTHPLPKYTAEPDKIPKPWVRPKNFGHKPRSEKTPLTTQQWIFVREWANGENINTAANKAGYEASQNYGYKLKEMPHIRKQYDLIMEENRRTSQLTRDDVLLGLKDSIEMARLMSEPATMIAGWREIGKMCGFYEPKKIDLNVSVNGSLILENMNKMSDEELLKIIHDAEAGVQDDGDEASPS